MRLILTFLIVFSAISWADDDQVTTDTPQKGYLTDKVITGEYYLAKDYHIRDIYVTTPVNGSFYFKIFIAQVPTKAKMTVQFYNEIEGVATFNKDIAYWLSPQRNCLLSFFFSTPKLVVEQRGSCEMSSEFGFEASGVYTQLEPF